MAEKIAFSLEIDASKSVKTLGEVEKSLKFIEGEMDNIHETNLLFEKDLLHWQKRFRETPKVALAARAHIEKEINKIKSALEDNNSALKNFRFKKSQITGIKKDLSDVEGSFEKVVSKQSLRSFSLMGKAVGELTGAFVLLGGGKDSALGESAERLKKGIGIAMGFKGAAGLIVNTQRFWNQTLKNNNTLTKANAKLNKITASTMKLLGLSTNTASKGFKGLKVAIASTGIGLLIVGIGALIANWKKLSSWLSNTTTKQLAYNEAAKKAIEAVGDELSAIDDLQKMLRDETVTREDKNKAFTELQKQYPDLLANIKAEEMSLQKLNIVLKKAAALTFEKAKADAIAEMKAEEYKKILQEKVDLETGENETWMTSVTALGMKNAGLTETIDIEKAAIMLSEQRIEDINETITVYDELTGEINKNIEAINGEITALTEESKVRREQETAIKKAWDEQEDMRKKRQEKLKADEAARKKRIAEAKKQKEKEQKDAEREEQKEIDRINRLKDTEAKALAQLILDIENMENEYSDSKLAKDQQEINAVTDKYFTLLELAKQNGIDTALLLEAQEAEKTAIKNKYQKIDKEENDEIAAREKESAESLRDFKIQMTLQGLEVIGKLAQAFAGQSEKEQKRAFQIQQAVGIASGLIQTYQSAIAAYASQVIPFDPSSVVRGAIAAGLAVAMGLANVALIAKQKFNAPAKSPPVTIPTGDLGGGNGGNKPPTINPVTNTSTLIPPEGSDTKVYVTETDITGVQNQVNVIEAQATIK